MSRRLLQVVVQPVAEQGSCFQWQPPPRGARKLASTATWPESARLHLTGRRVVVAIQRPRLRGPFALELSQSVIVLGHFSEVVPAKAALARVVDRVPLDQVIRPQRQRLSTATVESIEGGLAKHQDNRASQQPGPPGHLLFGQPQP